MFQNLVSLYSSLPASYRSILLVPTIVALLATTALQARLCRLQLRDVAVESEDRMNWRRRWYGAVSIGGAVIMLIAGVAHVSAAVAAVVHGLLPSFPRDAQHALAVTLICTTTVLAIYWARRPLFDADTPLRAGRSAQNGNTMYGYFLVGLRGTRSYYIIDALNDYSRTGMNHSDWIIELARRGIHVDNSW